MNHEPVRLVASLLFLAFLFCACDRKSAEVEKNPPARAEQQTRKSPPEEAPVETAGRSSDPLERIEDPGQRFVLILHGAFKRAERNPEHCGAAWEDMEAYLKSHQQDFRDAVVELIGQAVANPKESGKKMQQLTALSKELFGGKGDPMGAFSKRCPKEKDFLYAWINEEVTAAVKEWTATMQNKNASPSAIREEPESPAKQRHR